MVATATAQEILHAVFTFEGNLNDLLPQARKQKPQSVSFRKGQSVKHLIESLGVPHTEVERLLSNDHVLDFHYLVKDGDEIIVRPFSERGSDAPDMLQEAPPGERRFVLDNHLGKLAGYLRMLGFDTLYQNDYHDNVLAEIASLQERILLTRDRRLLMRNAVRSGYCIRSLDPRQQVGEVLRRYDLFDRILPFSRCMRCNGLLKSVSKEDVLERLEPLTKQYFDQFCACPDCQQVYWRGSHHERMLDLIKQVSS